MKCKRCNAEWEPQTWNFYGLCEACFASFDADKMCGIGGRLSRYGLCAETGEKAYEDAGEWVKAHPLSEDR